MGEKLILDASDRVSLQGSLLTFIDHLRLLLVQLFLEAGEHLEKLTFSGEPRFRMVGPHLWFGSWGRVFFTSVFDGNVQVGRRVDNPRAPSGHRLAFRSSGLGGTLPRGSHF